MWNQPKKEALDKIPDLYKTEKTPLKEKLIVLHFFLGGCDWFIVEYNGKDLLWGFAILNDDLLNAEWGYIPFEELKDVKVGPLEVDCDTGWKIRKAIEVEKIKEAQGW